MNKETKRVVSVLVLFCIGFVALIVYLSYFQVFKSEDIKNNAYNKRLWINEENVLRGSIMDRNNNILVYSEKKEKSNKRYYKYGRLYSHIIGYSSREYGKAGLELHYNNDLLAIRENTAINEIKNLVLPNSIGYNLKLTIDHSLQEKAHNLLKGKKGSIIAMNPETGEIYAMVSMPDFDVSNLEENWKGITDDDNKPLLNRSTQGLYPPGSIFKIITTAAALESENLDLSYLCKASTKIDGFVFKDAGSKGHGNIDLKDAFVKSCNTYYADKSLLIGKEKLASIAEDFMINKKIDFDLPVTISNFPYKGNLKKTDIAASAIGQGEVLVSPLNMAMVASTIANNGRMMRPILVKEVLNKDKQIIKSFETSLISQSLGFNTANIVKEMMLETVKSGTGTNARIKNVKVSGKTGTAENATGNPHSWFLGFAPFDNPKIAVAVIVEEGGSGGKVAAPMARDIIIHGLNNIKF